MTEHADDDPVLYHYASSRNITFRSQGGEELGLTWGEWRELTPEQRQEVITDTVFELVEIWIEGDE